MRALAAAELIALWEHGAPRHPLDRVAMLVAAARPELAPQTIADLPLGTVTETLLALRTASFGARIAGHADCERCGERMEFTIDARELLQPRRDGAVPESDVAGRRMRAPCLRDLAAVADESDPMQAARALLARCTQHGSGVLPNDDALRAAEDELEALDPNADLAIALRCVACGHESSAQLDAGALLWQEIEACAQTLLCEVHLLARAYGWSEAAILGLSPARRASYLRMVAS